MTRKDLTKRAADYLHNGGIRKPVSTKKKVFHISDDDGNSKDFIVKATDKTVMYTIDDIESILDALIEVTVDALKNGEPVTIRGFGGLDIKYRKERKTKIPMTDEWVTVDARCVPHFTFGHWLRMAAKQYELLLEEKGVDEPLPLFDDQEEDDE